MKIELLISPEKTYIDAKVRLDVTVNPQSFSPIIVKSIQKLLNSSESLLMSLQYTINANVKGIKISVVEGKTVLETNLPRDEAIELIKSHGEGKTVLTEVSMPFSKPIS